MKCLLALAACVLSTGIFCAVALADDPEGQQTAAAQTNSSDAAVKSLHAALNEAESGQAGQGEVVQMMRREIPSGEIDVPVPGKRVKARSLEGQRTRANAEGPQPKLGRTAPLDAKMQSGKKESKVQTGDAGKPRAELR